jgi:hypothetical protein
MIEKIKKGELKMTATNAQRNALIQMNEEFAKEYNLDYTIFTR